MPVPPLNEVLGPRELEVVELIAEGLSQKKIAARMVITEEGVRTHFHNIRAKLGLSAGDPFWKRKLIHMYKEWLQHPEPVVGPGPEAAVLEPEANVLGPEATVVEPEVKMPEEPEPGLVEREPGRTWKETVGRPVPPRGATPPPPPPSTVPGPTVVRHREFQPSWWLVLLLMVVVALVTWGIARLFPGTPAAQVPAAATQANNPVETVVKPTVPATGAVRIGVVDPSGKPHPTDRLTLYPLTIGPDATGHMVGDREHSVPIDINHQTGYAEKDRIAPGRYIMCFEAAAGSSNPHEPDPKVITIEAGKTVEMTLEWGGAGAFDNCDLREP